MSETAATPPPRRRPPRRPVRLLVTLALALAVLLAVLATLAWLALPVLASGPGAQLASRWLERPVSLRRLEFDPLHLALHLEDLRVGAWHARDGAQAADLEVAQADVRLATRSLWQGWPEIVSLHVQGPALQLRRTADGRLSVQDLMDRFLGRPSSGPPGALVLRDLVVSDARLVWQDDRLGSRHQVDGLQVELPFLSTRGEDAGQVVEPRLYGRLDGHLLVLYGSALRRDSGQDLTVHFEVEDLRLPDYADLLTPPAGLALRDGRFDARMDAHVTLRAGGLPGVRLAGQLALRDVDLRAGAGAASPLLSMAALQVPVRQADLDGRRLELGQVTVEGFALHASRAEDGHIDWIDIARAVQHQAGPAAAGPPAAVSAALRGTGGGRSGTKVDAPPAPPWSVAFAGLELRHGSFAWRDDVPPQPVRVAVRDATLTLGPAQWPARDPVGFALALQGDRGEGVYLGGLARPAVPDVDAEVRLQRIDANRFAPYFAGRLPLQVQAAPFSTRARLQGGLAAGGEAWARLEGLQFDLPQLRISRAGRLLAAIRGLQVRELAADSRDGSAHAGSVQWQVLQAPLAEGGEAESGAVTLSGLAADWHSGRYRLESAQAQALRWPALVSAAVLTGGDLDLDLGRRHFTLGSLGAAGLDTPGGLHAESIQLANASADQDSRRIEAGQLNAAGLDAPGDNHIQGVSLRGGAADLRQGQYRLERLAATGIALGGRAQLPNLEADQADLDLAARRARVGRLAASGARLELLRTAGGRLDPGTLAQALAALPTATAGGAAGTAKGGAWHAGVREIALDDCSGHLRDASLAQPADVRWTALSVHLSGVGTRLSHASGVQVSALLDQDTHVSLDGSLALDPLDGSLRLTASGVHPDDWLPWLPSRLPLTPHGGSVDVDGTLTLRGRLDAPAGLWDGQAGISGGELLDRPGGERLVAWDRVNLADLHLNTAPVDVAVGQATVDGLRVRLELLEDGSFNLSHALAGDRPAAPRATNGKDAVVVPAAAAAPADASAGGHTRSTRLQPQPSGPVTPFPLAIGRLVLRDGQASFSDRFVRPEYSAHLTALQGSVDGLSSQSTRPGRLELAGQLDGGASVRVSGTVQPLRQPLALDLDAVVRGFELGPLSSYSTRFTGFPIVRGKLSFDVGYHLHDGNITASNLLTLDQLTLGPRQDVRGIRQLPMDLAVSLLKDGDGVIHVDLPIQGTLSDPQFSLGSIVGELVTRAVERAITAPFRWLGSLFGGEHAEDLGWIGFAPGSDSLDDAAVAKLTRLATALRARPALRLDITARGDAALDAQGLAQDLFHQKLLVQKIQRLVEAGVPVERPQDITWDEAEQPALLTAAWRQEHPGQAVPEDPRSLERDLRDGVRTDAAELSGLATRRQRAAQDWLTGTGGIDPARVFLVGQPDAGQAASEAPGGGVAPPPARVDFTVR